MSSAARRRCTLTGTALVLFMALGSLSAAAPDPHAAAPAWRHFPKRPTAPAGAPNVLLIMTDDVGFGSSSTFGGPIPTPSLDALAARGLRYNAFHTTAMCSPTRAALLTGRNHHAVASGSITNVAIDEAGYTSVIPTSAATIGRILRDNGYDTAFFGKNHNTPLWETGPLGPFDHWPNAWGFDYFYGFNGAADDQFRPHLIENRNQVEPPSGPDYILDKDLADHLIHWLGVQHAEHANRPFFVYLAPGTMHSPHQAPPAWIAKFKGQFAMGWDQLREQTFARQKAMGIIPRNAVLTPRPSVLQAWDSLSPQARQMYAHQMEVAAAQLAYFDHQTDRILAALKASGELDNTLTIYLQGDNGASMDSVHGSVQELQSLIGIEPTEQELIATSDLQGTRHAYSNYHPAWAWAQNAPFPWGKQIASHLGGLRDGLVISWPRRIKPDARVRRQFHHVIDLAPTIYEAAGITPPEDVDGIRQQPIDGVSMVYTFDHPDTPSSRHEQYFEMLGNRSYYKDGWMASTTPGRAPFDRSTDPIDPMKFKWELYNLDDDYSQSTDIAARYPAKLAELEADFDAAARRNQVHPIVADLIGRVGPGKRPAALDPSDNPVFPAGDTRYPDGTFPGLAPGWQLTAAITCTSADADGPIVSAGDEAGGAGLFLDKGKPTYLYNATARAAERVQLVGQPLAPGFHAITISVSADPAAGPRAARLAMLVDGQPTDTANIPVFYPVRGEGVVGRYGVRTLQAELANPPVRGLQVQQVEFSRAH
ncbi:MAG: arylsulfatase [Gammaproteobacteria bacterium]|nr:arylsulfatase [Gammaproteobacteria bacterium]